MMCFGNQHTFTLGASTTGGDMPTSLSCACGAMSRADIAPVALLQAEVARLNRWITQIHYELAEHAVTNQEPTGIWAMGALERAMRDEAAG